jgi:hypothetical protein
LNLKVLNDECLSACPAAIRKLKGFRRKDIQRRNNQQYSCQNKDLLILFLDYYYYRFIYCVIMVTTAPKPPIRVSSVFSQWGN